LLCWAQSSTDATRIISHRNIAPPLSSINLSPIRAGTVLPITADAHVDDSIEVNGHNDVSRPEIRLISLMQWLHANMFTSRARRIEHASSNIEFQQMDANRISQYTLYHHNTASWAGADGSRTQLI
jgi:hypothetical protein